MSEQNNNFFIEEWEEEGKPSKEDRVLGAICYAHFLFLAPFFLEKDTEFLKFHMKQWWILYVLFVLINIILMIFFPITISLRLLGLIWLVYTWMCIFAWYRAYRGIKYEFWFLATLIEIVWEKLEWNK